ncbi:helix-turn-helix domain-containing protein, partial [Paenibacillus sp. MCAF20]
MDIKTLRKLLKDDENSLLDFKATFYDIQENKSKTDFVKDVLSFSNSTVSHFGYIICGVKDDGTGNKEIIGVDPNVSIDDARWVQLLNGYTSHPVKFKIMKVKL